MHWETEKFLWLTLLWYSLYCSGLELNPHYLQGMPVYLYFLMRKLWPVTGLRFQFCIFQLSLSGFPIVNIYKSQYFFQSFPIWRTHMVLHCFNCIALTILGLVVNIFSGVYWVFCFPFMNCQFIFLPIYLGFVVFLLIH